MVRNYKRRTTDNWSRKDLPKALVEMKRGAHCVDVADKYGIPRSTLYRRFNKYKAAGFKMGAVKLKHSGARPILTRAEESVLEKSIKVLVPERSTTTSEHVRRICFEHCKASKKLNKFKWADGMASRDWFEGFMKRHPGLKTIVKGKTKPGDSRTAQTD